MAWRWQWGYEGGCGARGMLGLGQELSWGIGSGLDGFGRLEPTSEIINPPTIWERLVRIGQAIA